MTGDGDGFRECDFEGGVGNRYESCARGVEMRVRDEEVSIAIIQEIEREGEAQGREGGDDGGGGDMSVFDGVGVDGAGLGAVGDCGEEGGGGRVECYICAYD